MDIIVGTAGHIDHGKTALVKALTGVETDRFPEEKQRGITIDIGFADLEIADARIGFVDVPGHERFVKNMLAGASGIDAVALVVAADEGVMPQTREHFEICRLLETSAGIVVLTKKDLVDDELLEFVRLDVAELVAGSFLENAPVVAVSSRSGDGIDELKKELLKLASAIPERTNETVFRLPIDRAFTVKGFGAVVTGTLVAGKIVEGDEADLMPLGRKVRVRGIQSHGKSVGEAHAGRRTAVNLAGVDHGEIERGMTLTEKNTLRPTHIFDAEIELLKSEKNALRSRRRVRVHIGTVEALARVHVIAESGEIAPGDRGFVQLRLETPIVCIPGERFIVRQYSPQTTIAGGRVIDNSPIKHRRRDAARMNRILSELVSADRPKTVRILLEKAAGHGLNFADLQARTGWTSEILRAAIADCTDRKSIIDAGGVFIARTPFDELKSKTLAALSGFHGRDPLARGMMRETLREQVFSKLPAEVFRGVIAKLADDNAIVTEKDLVRDSGHNPELSAAEKVVLGNLSRNFKTAGLEVPKLAEALSEAARGSGIDVMKTRKLFQLLLNSGEITRVTDEFYFNSEALAAFVAKVKDFAASSSDRLIDVAQFKDVGGFSRKYAIPLLEYFDRERITRRAGDKRLVL